MTATTAPSPQPPAPQPLPPTPRDFDILHMSHVLHVSTRQIAEKHGISQTRVRQIVQRVCHWLAANLPAKTEADQEAEARLARHLAADQLQQQLELLQSYFDGSGDPKYLRQQTRVIASLARLGVIPGAIDSLAADITEGPLTGHEPQAPWSEDHPWANRRRVGDVEPVEPRPHHSPSDHQPPSTDHGPLTTDNLPSTTDNCPLTTDSPSVRDCSPSRSVTAQSSAVTASSFAASAGSNDLSDQNTTAPDDDPQGLKLLERRLLTLLESAQGEDRERRDSLENNLASIRKQRASLELRLSPHQPGAALEACGAGVSAAHAAANGPLGAEYRA